MGEQFQKEDTVRFTWGDTVKVSASAAAPLARRGAFAAVCGIRAVETVEQATALGVPVGSTLYLVEFGDGASLELREEAREPAGP